MSIIITSDLPESPRYPFRSMKFPYPMPKWVYKGYKRGSGIRTAEHPLVLEVSSVSFQFEPADEFPIAVAMVEERDEDGCLTHDYYCAEFRIAWMREQTHMSRYWIMAYVEDTKKPATAALVPKNLYPVVLLNTDSRYI